MKSFIFIAVCSVFLAIYGIIHRECGYNKGYDDGYKDGASDSENKWFMSEQPQSQSDELKRAIEQIKIDCRYNASVSSPAIEIVISAAKRADALERDVMIRDAQYKEAFGAWDKERDALRAELTMCAEVLHQGREWCRQVVALANINNATRDIFKVIGNAFNTAIYQPITQAILKGK